MIPKFDDITQEFLARAPEWWQDKPVIIKKQDYDFYKTVNGINIYKLRHKNSEVNIFILYFYFDKSAEYVYFLSPEAEDEETGESIYPVYCIGYNKNDFINVDSITFEFNK